MLQGPNKLKNYRFRWLSKPLRLAKFESFWIQVCAIVTVSRIPGNVSLLALSFWQSFLNDSVLIFYYSIPLSMLATFPFYSVILGFGYHWFSPLVSLSTKAPVMSTTLIVGSFPVSDSFHLLVLFLSGFSPFGLDTLVPHWQQCIEWLVLHVYILPYQYIRHTM